MKIHNYSCSTRADLAKALDQQSIGWLSDEFFDGRCLSVLCVDDTLNDCPKVVGFSPNFSDVDQEVVWPASVIWSAVHPTAGRCLAFHRDSATPLPISRTRSYRGALYKYKKELPEITWKKEVVFGRESIIFEGFEILYINQIKISLEKYFEIMIPPPELSEEKYIKSYISSFNFYYNNNYNESRIFDKILGEGWVAVLVGYGELRKVFFVGLDAGVARLSRELSSGDSIAS